MKFFRLFPTALVAIGIAIHLLALLGFSVSETANWVHWLMLSLDTTVFIGLLKQTTWGYWLAVALFFQQSIFQSYWAYGAIKYNWYLWHLQAATAFFCIMSLFCLLKFENIKSR